MGRFPLPTQSTKWGLPILPTGGPTPIRAAAKSVASTAPAFVENAGVELSPGYSQEAAPGNAGATYAQGSTLPEGFHDGMEGTVDANSCTAVGWAVDPDDRNRDLQVQILSDGSPVITMTANLLREDVGACPGGTCGFGVNLWGLISAGQVHQITAQAYDEETEAWLNLGATPKSLTCQSPLYLPLVIR